MFQTNIDSYAKIIEAKLPEYLASLPDPSVNIKEYASDMPNDGKCKGLPTEWWDVAAVTALIRNHKDSKNKYEVNSYVVELLTTMFRVAMHELHWFDDDSAYRLASMLAYDEIPKTTEDKTLFNEMYYAVRRFPYAMSEQVWYSYLMPLLAYSKQSKFDKPNYMARYMTTIINKNGIQENDGDHARDLNVDSLKCIPSLGALLDMCKRDTVRHAQVDELLRNACIEYATVYLGCMLRRSAITEDFGKIGAEVVAYHYVEYQEISQLYFKQKQDKEK